jgi:hypothetical protein
MLQAQQIRLIRLHAEEGDDVSPTPSAPSVPVCGLR